MILSEVVLKQGDRRLPGYTTPAVAEAVAALYVAQIKYLQAAYARPDRPPGYKRLGVNYRTASSLRQIARRARLQGTGIPQLARPLFAPGAWRIIMGGVIVQVEPGDGYREHASHGFAAIFCDPTGLRRDRSLTMEVTA